MRYVLGVPTLTLLLFLILPLGALALGTSLEDLEKKQGSSVTSLPSVDCNRSLSRCDTRLSRMSRFLM